MPDDDRRPEGEDDRPGSALTALATSALAVIATLALLSALVLVFGERPDLTAQPEPGPSPSATTSETDFGSTPTPTASVPPGIEVVVLNGTDRQGLAARFAERLKALGWPVRGVDNFSGTVPATTIYYPPDVAGMEAAAQALDAQFPDVNRVRERFGNLNRTALTVILMDDYVE